MDKYIPTIGLEIHIQLNSQSKVFASDSSIYNSDPNVHVGTVTSGMPGTLPSLNEIVIEKAIALGLACNCTIASQISFDRKNYFYQDLPKGYQITQDNNPVCQGGHIEYLTHEGYVKQVLLNRIHIEEDAGKSIHGISENNTGIDLNRAGTALLEMVTEPVIASAEEAYFVLSEIRKIVRHLAVGDGNMEQGSLRCDANISVRPHTQSELGSRVEIKNLNSINFVKKALDYEILRQIEILTSGASVLKETRGYDESTNETFSIRYKEEADDYRYFSDPDLQPVVITKSQIDSIQKIVPSLPVQLAQKFINKWGLAPANAIFIAGDKETCDYFEQTMTHTNFGQAASNWITGPVKSYVNEHNCSMSNYPLTAKKLADVIDLVESDEISFHVASSRLILAMMNNPEADATVLIKSMALSNQTDILAIESIVSKILDSMPEKVAAYKAGKKGLLKLFVGSVMKNTNGTADPQITTNLIKQKLDS